MTKQTTKVSKQDVEKLLKEIDNLRDMVEAYRQRELIAAQKEEKLIALAQSFDDFSEAWSFSPSLTKAYSEAAAKIREVLNDESD